MALILKNLAKSTLSIGITSAVLTLNVQVGAGALFPVLGAGDYFYAALQNASGTIEFVKVTARVGDVMTIVRAQGSTNAIAWAAGDVFAQRLTIETFQEYIAQQLTRQIQPVVSTVATNALTVSLSPTALDFRNTTLGSGVVLSRTIAVTISLVVPNTATLGTVNATSARLILIAIDNAGTVELAITNFAGGLALDETGLISTTAISVGSIANNVIYSTTTRTNVAYRVVGFIDITEAVAGTWATAPTTIQGIGGEVLSGAFSALVAKTTQTGSAQIPTGTTAQRDATPIVGYFRYNSTVNAFEGYSGTAWGSVGGGATGAGGDTVFVENSRIVTTNYTLTTGKSAVVVGPLVINNGVTVTVPSGQRLVIL